VSKNIDDLLDLDVEIKTLLLALNKCDFIETTRSCWGHNKYQARVWFKVNDVAKFNEFLKCCFNDLESNWLISILQPDENTKENEINCLLQSYLKGSTKNIELLANTIERNYNSVYNKPYLALPESKIIQFSIYKTK
jgi:hypothetical protein